MAPSGYVNCIGRKVYLAALSGRPTWSRRRSLNEFSRYDYSEFGGTWEECNVLLTKECDKCVMTRVLTMSRISRRPSE